MKRIATQFRAFRIQHLRLLIVTMGFVLCFLSGFSQSGTIIVNGSTTWPVSYNTQFPIWLPGGSGASVNIGANVTSISGILFNVVPNGTGNELTVNAIVNITSNTPIAAGTALKIEGILFTSATGSGSGSSWVVGGNTPGGTATLGTNDNSALSIQSGTGALNVGTDPGAKTITIGTSSNTVNITANNLNETISGTAIQTGATSINTTGSAATTIGSASSATTVGGVLNVNGNLAKINGATYNWPASSTTTAGYVLTNNGSGTLTWASPQSINQTSGSTPGASSASSNSATWNTPGAFSVTVPAGVTQMTVDMAGAQGGTGNYQNANYHIGGYGGRVVASYPVTGGSTIFVSVGAAGGNYGGSGGGGGYLNDATGGAGGIYTVSGPYTGGGGGGSSDIRIGGTALANRVLVAAGGGGGAGQDPGNNACKGGPGGATTAALGAGFTNNVQNGSRTACGIATGSGGTVSGPGAGGCWTGYCSQSNGGTGPGGNANNCANGGGGGGGGYFGGGGGAWSGGGGGANYTGPSAVSPVSTTGYQGNSWQAAPLNGYVTIYWY